METFLIIAAILIVVSLVVFIMRCIGSFMDSIPGTTWTLKKNNMRDLHLMRLAPRIFGVFVLHCVLLAAVFLFSMSLV